MLSDGRESQQYLVSVCSQGNSKSSCQTKISQFDGSCFIDEQVLRLQVPVDDSVRVAKAYTLQQLEKVVLRREEILDKATTETISKVWSCEPTHFGSFINLDGKYDLAIMQHQACRPEMHTNCSPSVGGQRHSNSSSGSPFHSSVTPCKSN